MESSKSRPPKISMYVAPEFHKRIKIASAESGQSMTKIIINAVSEYLDKMDNDRKE